MRMNAAVGLVVLIFAVTACTQSGPKILSLWTRARSPEGWTGQRYSENGLPVREQFDAVGDDGAVDVWRFYQRGILIREERELKGNGIKDFTVWYSPVTRDLIALERDTDGNSTTDYTLRYTERGTWIETIDINGDDAAERQVTLRGDHSLLRGVDSLAIKDVRAVVPKTALAEVAEDRSKDGVLDTWTRFRDGQPIQAGTLDEASGRVQWQTVPVAPKPEKAASPTPAPKE